MTLDLAKVSMQVQRMGEQLRDSRGERVARLDLARAQFRRLAPRWEELADGARKSRVSAAAAPREPLDAVHPRPETAPAYEVLATDGSTIEPDRHGPAMCALVNVGRVRIRYGPEASAALDSEPRLYFRSEDLYLSQGGARRLLSERLLDARRSVAEMAALADLGRKAAADVPRVALADGLLTIWRQDWAEADADMVENELRAALDTIAEVRLPLAAYVSNPHSHWVVDLLRQATGCQSGTLGCTAGCAALAENRPDPPPSHDDLCALGGLVDVQLYEHLQSGERSGVFEVVGRDQDRYGAHNRSNFFYLHVGSETARVEVPGWVAEDVGALDLIQAVICDQAERGQGYPAALARAHEQAVLTAQDRRAFEQLVVEALQRAGQRTGLSEKRISKNLRAV